MTGSQRGARRRVALIFGGPAGEHEISCASAAAIFGDLDPTRFVVDLVRITTDGTWIARRAMPSQEHGAIRDVCNATPESGDLDRTNTLEVLMRAKLAICALHGPWGEDGTVQGLLGALGVPYLGSGVAASAVAMDKDLAKRVVGSVGIRVAPWALARGPGGLAPEDRERLKLPVFVKPARAGSSVGITRITTWDGLGAAIEEALEWDEKVLVEQAVHGAEIDLGVLEHPDGRIEIGPPLQIEHHSERGFFDYEAKYRDSATRFVIPAPLSPEQRAELDAVAERAFRAIGCRDLARVDFLLPPDGGPVFSEINTFPGFSAGSQYPQIWAAAGRPLGTLLELLIDGVERRS